MKMSAKVGNQTNSTDPQAINSRVFVGNLNTYQVAKEDVERMFKRYGRVLAISMHKGYAFVQYTNPYDARNAATAEDGAVVCGQTLDVNMVSEPKPHQGGRKRSNVPNNSATNECFMSPEEAHMLDTQYANEVFAESQPDFYESYNVPPQRMTPPMKRPRIGVMNSQKRPKMNKSLKAVKVQSVPYSQLNTYTNPDVLICGNCKESFASLHKLVEHKKSRCRLRFYCRCQEIGCGKCDNEPAAFLCATCKDRFVTCWDLVHHVQTVHEMIIYEVPSDVASMNSLNSCEKGDMQDGQSGSLDEGHFEGDPDNEAELLIDEQDIVDDDGGNNDDCADTNHGNNHQES